MKVISEYEIDKEEVEKAVEKWERWGLLQDVRQPEELALLLEDYTEGLLRERDMFNNSTEEDQKKYFCRRCCGNSISLVGPYLENVRRRFLRD